MRDLSKKVYAADRKAFKGLDPIDVVLHLCGKYTFLPEIFEIFGPEKAWQFLSVFGGRTIKVPSDRAVQESVSHLIIWTELSGSHDSQRETIKRLAQRYDMKDSEVRAAAARVQELIDEQRRFQDQLAEHLRGSEGEDSRPAAIAPRKRRRARADRPDAGVLGEAQTVNQAQEAV